MENHAPKVGLLCSRDDSFGMIRSEMMVGPMLLAGITPVRFYSADIHSDGVCVNGSVHRNGAWTPCKQVKLKVVHDLTIPKSIRLPGELRLLEHVPHTKRIDLDRYELLEVLKSDESLSGFVPMSRPLTDTHDIRSSIEEFGSVVIKSRMNANESGPLFLREDSLGWTIADRIGMRQIADEAFQSETSNRIGTHFIQAFKNAKTPQGRTYALLCSTQQTVGMTWLKPTIHCVVGNHPVFASLASCGEYIGAPFAPTAPVDVLDGRILPPGQGVRLAGLVVAVARCIAQQMKGEPGVLALTIVMDSDLKLHIVDIDARPAAPRRPARNLEFYRHCAEFLREMALPPPIIATKPRQQQIAPLALPADGITIRAAIHETDVAALKDNPPSWIDLPIVYGSRCLLKAFAGVLEPRYARDLCITIRLGNAINDLGCPSHEYQRISTIEDYLGKGLLSWAEYQVMRSIRKEFLEAQLAFADKVCEGYAPNALIVEDFDIGAGALSASELPSVVAATVDWLDRMTVEGRCQSWGIGFSSGGTVSTGRLIDRILELDGQRGRFKLACFRNKLPDTALTERLIERGVRVVVVAGHAQTTLSIRRSRPEYGLLTPWVPVRCDR